MGSLPWAAGSVAVDDAVVVVDLEQQPGAAAAAAAWAAHGSAMERRGRAA
jgi:hypothetical protein